MKAQIKRADRACAWFEATQLAGFSAQEADRFFTRPKFPGAEDFRLAPLSPREARERFLDRFHELMAAMEARDSARAGR